MGFALRSHQLRMNSCMSNKSEGPLDNLIREIAEKTGTLECSAANNNLIEGDQSMRTNADSSYSASKASDPGEGRGPVRRLSLIVSAAARELEEELLPSEDDDDDNVEADYYGLDDDSDYEKAFFASLTQGKSLEKPTTDKTNSCSLTVMGTGDAPTVAETIDSSSASECDSFDETGTKVRFSTVSIRTYSLTVGTHNKAKAYPLALDWEHTPTETLDIDLFEEVFCSACTKPKRKVVRGFRRPHRMSPNQRFRRLRAVTGQRQEYIYELELERTNRENALPATACHSDEGYDEDESRNHPYQLADVDDYQIAEC